MLKKALQKAKKEEEKKVSINFQVPLSLKEKFDNLCRENEVSLTALLNSLMQTAIEEDNIETYNIIRGDIKSFDRISDKKSNEVIIENKDLLISMKKRFNEYIKQKGYLLPTTNDYMPNHYEDMSMYPIIIDSWLELIKKDEKCK